jgi:predicted hotdog family 3-hydroxylacyl-ACP dehydratase
VGAPAKRAPRGAIPEYVADLLRMKDEGLMAALAFMGALKRGEADETTRRATIRKILERLSPEARALAEAHPDAFG